MALVNRLARICFVSVSYTHLDVYKRQQEELACGQSPSLREKLLRELYQNPAVEIKTGTTVTSVGERSLRASSNGHETAIEDLDTIIIAAGAQPYNPVSYTHLTP